MESSSGSGAGFKKNTQTSIKKKQKEPIIKKWEYKFDQKLKLEEKEKEEEFKFENLKQNEQVEPKLKEDMISKLEDFDIDQNIKNYLDLWEIPSTEDLKTLLQFRPVIGKRHYIKTGNFRYMTISLIYLSELNNYIDDLNKLADGEIHNSKIITVSH